MKSPANMIWLLFLGTFLLLGAEDTWAYGPSIHSNIPHAAARLYTREPLRSVLLRNRAHLHLGASWTDITNSIGQNYRKNTPPIEAYLSPNGKVDQQKLRKALEELNIEQRMRRYVSDGSLDEVMSWNLFYDVGWVDTHTFYAADWWIREIRKALKEGNEHKIAFVCGAYTHSLEIATAFKSSRLPFVPYIGGGAFCTDLVRLYQNYYLNSSLGQRERNIDVFQKKSLEYTYPWDESLTQLPGLVLLTNEVPGYFDKSRQSQLTPVQREKSKLAREVIAELRRVFGHARIPENSHQMPASLARLYGQFEMTSQESVEDFQGVVLETLAKAIGKE